MLRAGALGWPWGMGWAGRCEGGSGWGTHVHPWLIHVNVWQKPLQYFKVISLQLNFFLKKREVKKEGIQMSDEHMIRWSTSLVIWEMQIKTTVRYHSRPNTMAKMKKNGKYKVLINMWSKQNCCWECRLVEPLGTIYTE